MLRGKVDTVSKGRALGWIWDDAYPTRPVEFDLLVNKVKVGRFAANIFRADLERHGIGSGDHAFEVPLDPSWIRTGGNLISVLVGGQAPKKVPPLQYEHAPAEAVGANLQSPSNASAPVRTVRGRLERIQANTLHGWLWDIRSLNPVEFTLLVNENPVGQFVASEVRPDLIRENIGSGAHAFKIPVDRAWLSTGDNVFTVRTIPDQQRLPDALVYTRPDKTLATPGVSAPKPAKKPEAKPRPVTSALTQQQIADALNSWPTKRLTAFHTAFETEVVLRRARQLLKEKKWDELSQLYPSTRPDRRGRTEMHVLIGRGLLQNRENDKAAGVLSAIADQNKDAVAAHFYAAIANARAGRFENAVSYGRAALKLAPDNKQYLIDHASNCRRLSTRIEGDVNQRRALLLESIDALDRAMRIDDERLDHCLLQKARSQLELDQHDAAVATINRLLERSENSVEGLLLLSQAYVALNRIGEALAVAEHVIELDPLRQGPRFLLRSLRAMIGDEQARPATFGVARWNAERRIVEVSQTLVDVEEAASGATTTVEFSANPAMALAAIPIDWLLVADGGEGDVQVDPTRLKQMRASAPSWAGRLVGGDGLVFWRRELLIGLADSGAIENIGALSGALRAVEDVVETFDLDRPRGERQDMIERGGGVHEGPVVVMSRHGIVKFGGGEQFLDSMAEHYEAMGYDPIIVGTRPERKGEEGTENGRRFAFIDTSPAALRAFFLQVRPRFVHVLSSLGYEVAEALEYLTIPFVYGVHFWRDCLGKTEGDTLFFTDLDKGPIPKPAFRYIIEKAETIYSNSQYTRAVLEEAFQLRTPVVYSIPREVDSQSLPANDEAVPELGELRDYVLLVNARSDKGLDLLIETAKRLPLVHFVAIASQTERNEAEAVVQAAGLTNFHIVGHTNRMDILYSRAKVATVPSYQFVETFSRVCIEAQRFGKPVFGSTVGNVPYLLQQSGTVLPEDTDAWVAAITRLFSDPDHYADLCARALVNSEEYSYRQQASAIGGVISTLSSPMLIGVGSGIGNMMHVTPMIRNIVRRTGRKVDLVLTEDHDNSLFLLHNDQYVNSVYSARQSVLRRRYDTVFITHCFGDARLPFQAKNVIFARDWIGFKPAGPLHEAAYNLEAAKQLLGVPYDEDDVLGYYIGNYSYTPPPLGPIRIGIHGGSKEGFWRSKRWPGHSELADRLVARGFEVSSFGTPEEYVPGTIDQTGGTISEMVERMLPLHYLVSNDSGLMNIANALGLPVTALFGPTNPLTRAPLRPIGRWIAVEKSCSPCEVTREGRDTFHAGACQCIGEIPVDRVEQSVLAHLIELYPEISGLARVA